MLRTALLGGNSITLDADMSKYIETLSEQGVIEGLEVSSNSVAAGKAWVKATRSNGETIMTLVQNTEALAVDTSGTKKIWLEIKQEAIDNGALNNEDGTGIASIKTGPSVPSQNFLLLASVADGQIKDERNLIPKIQSVAQKTSTLEEKMESAEGQISQLAEAGTPSYLGITGIVGEKYTMEDTLFLQKTPTLADALISINVGDVDANKEQHIQRIASGTASNQLKLKMDKFGAPTTSVIVEVRKGVKVDVSEKEAYWYGGDELLASASLPYTTFTTEAQEITVNLSQSFQLPKGELFSVVVKQENGIVNASNYYRLYCDDTQYSEAFSVVGVDGESRVRSKLMPYCVSEGGTEKILVKTEKNLVVELQYKGGDGQYPTSSAFVLSHTVISGGDIETKANMSTTNGVYGDTFFVASSNGATKEQRYSSSGVQHMSIKFLAKKGDKIQAGYRVGYHHGNTGKVILSNVSIIEKITLQKNGRILFPRGSINIGENLSTTALGTDQNNNRKSAAFILNINAIVANVQSSITVPSDGFLEIKWDASRHRAGYVNSGTSGSINGEPFGNCAIRDMTGGTNLTGYGRFFVTKGEVIIGAGGNVEIKRFISL